MLYQNSSWLHHTCMISHWDLVKDLNSDCLSAVQVLFSTEPLELWHWSRVISIDTSSQAGFLLAMAINSAG